jgi:hypothetical protein
MKVRNPKDVVLKAYQAHPDWTHRQLSLATGVTNVRYHLLKLHAEGLVKLHPMNRKCEQRAKTRVSRMRDRGEGPLPRLSRERQARLIEQVVEKAISRERLAFSFDVIRVDRAPFLRLKCHRVG